MADAKIKLDLFLNEQNLNLPELLAYLEQDDQNNLRVIVSVWNKAGAYCEMKFAVNKSEIESVVKTNDQLHILGKSYTIVKVFFKRNASISMGDLFSQVRSGSIRIHDNWGTDPHNRHPYGDGIA